MSQNTKPKLLFVTPWTPRSTGSGPAMRAYYSLQALAERYDPHVLIAGVYEGSEQSPPGGGVEARYGRVGFSWLNDPALAARCLLYEFFPQTYFQQFGKPSEWRFATARSLWQAARAFAGVHFDLIHVFRLYAAPYAKTYRDSSPNAATQLDFDDMESVTRERVAALYATNGEAAMARRLRRDAAEYRRLEDKEVRMWQRVFVSSERDLQYLRDELAADTAELLPNVVPVGKRAVRTEPADFHFLFVGQLGYYPNADSVRFFISEIWPRILQKAEMKVVLDVVGAGAPESLTRALEATRNVRFHGRVEDLRSLYEEAGAAIVPLRAGGGTRIKILEAFAEGVPVVSTALGAEGLRVTDGEHLLVADAAAGFSEACLRLARDQSLRQRLREKAHLRCAEHYGPAAMRVVLERHAARGRN